MTKRHSLLFSLGQPCRQFVQSLPTKFKNNLKMEPIKHIHNFLPLLQFKQTAQLNLNFCKHKSVILISTSMSKPQVVNQKDQLHKSSQYSVDQTQRESKLLQIYPTHTRSP